MMRVVAWAWILEDTGFSLVLVGRRSMFVSLFWWEKFLRGMRFVVIDGLLMIRAD